MMEGISLRYIVSTYVNITMYPPVQLLYAHKNFKIEGIWALGIKRITGHLR
jgi:hypothetical protein